MEKKSPVAFDILHIKQYVIPTDKLKEIRGASSILAFESESNAADSQGRRA